MSISKELFLSLLAMDCYNRGYGSGVGGLASTPGVSISTARIFAVPKIVEGQEAESDIFKSGFYAVAYKVAAGTWAGLDRDVTVISYRGTDEYVGNATAGGSDIVNGWPAALLTNTSQVDWAIKFYNEVVGIATPGKTVYGGPAADTIIVGHSLGGGLAEVVSLISGTPGFGFDRMPAATMCATSR